MTLLCELYKPVAAIKQRPIDLVEGRVAKGREMHKRDAEKKP